MKQNIPLPLAPEMCRWQCVNVALLPTIKLTVDRQSNSKQQRK